MYLPGNGVVDDGSGIYATLIDENEYLHHQVASLQQDNTRIYMLNDQFAYEIYDLKAQCHFLSLAHSVRNKTTDEFVRERSFHWIHGVWLAGQDPLLARAEESWERNQVHHAVQEIWDVLESTDVPPHTLVNANILLSAIYQDCDQPIKAYDYIAKALQLADDYRLHDLVGKAQFHRALCLCILSQWGEASWALTLATGTRYHDKVIKTWKAKAEAQRKRLHQSDSRKYVPSDFERIPSRR